MTREKICIKRMWKKESKKLIKEGAVQELKEEDRCIARVKPGSKQFKKIQQKNKESIWKYLCVGMIFGKIELSIDRDSQIMIILVLLVVVVERTKCWTKC